MANFMTMAALLKKLIFMTKFKSNQIKGIPASSHSWRISSGQMLA